MKIEKKIAVILLATISIISYYYSNKDKNINILLLDNIEAMAEDEKNTNERCYGLGDIECGGEKVMAEYAVR